jgi:hypothetical protein
MSKEIHMHPLTNENTAIETSSAAGGSVQIGPLHWNEAVQILLAAHLCGTYEGRKEAASHIVRMAQIADLAQDAVTLLNKLPEQTLEPLGDEWTRLREAVLRHAKDLSLSTYATTADADQSEAEQPSRRRLGALAQRCRRELDLDVYYSGAGFYLGTYTEDGPYTRESQEYWRTREQAQRALESGQWTQRNHL